MTVEHLFQMPLFVSNVKYSSAFLNIDSIFLIWSFSSHLIIIHHWASHNKLWQGSKWMHDLLMTRESWAITNRNSSNTSNAALNPLLCHNETTWTTKPNPFRCLSATWNLMQKCTPARMLLLNVARWVNESLIYNYHTFTSWNTQIQQMTKSTKYLPNCRGAIWFLIICLNSISHQETLSSWERWWTSWKSYARGAWLSVLI